MAAGSPTTANSEVPVRPFVRQVLRDSSMHAQGHLPLFRLETCLAYQNQPGFYFHTGRFWDSLSDSYEGDPPLPGLLTAMYLLGCSFARNPALPLAVEPHYYDRARRLQQETLGDPSVNLVQWLLASCLLAYYQFRTSRFLEARQEVIDYSSLSSDRFDD